MYSAMDRAFILKKIEFNPCKDVEIYSTKEIREKKLKHANIKFIPYEKIGDFLDAALKDNYTY